MTRRYFGTDGIRGQVGTAPMTVDFALRLASAAARALAPQGGTVLIGKDTRVSGYMFESALEAGFVAAGVDVLLTGPLLTPAVAVLTKKLGADFGQKHAEALLENQHLIPKEWRGYYLVFPGTVWQDSSGDRDVPCLYWDGGRWRLNFLWLGHDWGSDGRLLRPCK